LLDENRLKAIRMLSFDGAQVVCGHNRFKKKSFHSFDLSIHQIHRGRNNSIKDQL